MDKMSPAVPIESEKTWNELSPQEFQHMLSSWFQEKGLVQDMKSYLKFQMINVLKNTAIGKSIRKSASQTYSLAQQALHLVVAEYLLYYQCHFALSLFSTEVNLANILPEAKLFYDPQNVSKETAGRFDKENLVNILELVGLPKGSPYFSIVFNDYFNKDCSSLLHCLLSLIGKGGGKPLEDDELKIDNIDFENNDFLENIHQLLQASNLPPKTQTHLLHNLKVCYDSKFKTYETQVFQLVSKFKKELHSHEQKLHRAQRRRKCLEKRLYKLQNENQMLREKIDDEKVIHSERIAAVPCSLCHCNEECSNVKRQWVQSREEVEKLQSINTKQKEEIEILSGKCDELLKEFHSCQSKISLVSSRLHDEVIYDQDSRMASKDRGSSLSLSSDSLTEEILNEARRKLKMLEEESEELDIRFNQFVIK